MQILKTKEELILWRKSQILQDCLLGFVPTMGALHEGHLSLIESSKKDNAKTIVSIFVNPTQFGVNEDFDKYPRDESSDIALCQSCGVDAVFMPSVMEMYKSKDEVFLTPPPNLANTFEGALREGHFSGVMRVVLKFFNLISPHNAYFGQKDAQQLLIIQKMVSDLFLNINIVRCPIVRDSNGLALSSRNRYLTAESYSEALKIPTAINAVNEAFQNGELDSIILENTALKHLEGIKIDYCKIVDFNLKAIKKVRKNASLLLLAVRVKIPSTHRKGKNSEVRLLDNIWF